MLRAAMDFLRNVGRYQLDINCDHGLFGLIAFFVLFYFQTWLFRVSSVANSPFSLTHRCIILRISVGDRVSLTRRFE